MKDISVAILIFIRQRTVSSNTSLELSVIGYYQLPYRPGAYLIIYPQKLSCLFGSKSKCCVFGVCPNVCATACGNWVSATFEEKCVVLRASRLAPGVYNCNSVGGIFTCTSRAWQATMRPSRTTVDTEMRVFSAVEQKEAWNRTTHQHHIH